ncbi:MAG TPA: response regulator [Actinomycetota bacterium]|nr:response regulator [Actinomycetota bacterium]
MSERAPTAKRSRVLVADDDPGIVAVVEAVLVEAGFEVHSASDGNEALEQVALVKPDVVLLDLMMPRLDGMEVCKRIRANPKTRDLCVVMLTARTFAADEVMGLGAGADDYVTKPFDPGELPERITQAVRRNRDSSALHPLTRLPGQRQMEEMQARLVEEDAPFALMRIDLDDFEIFNDRYGGLRGDMAIRLLGVCVQAVIARTAGSRGFVGHLGGDDMVAIVDAELAEATAQELIVEWEAARGEVYDSRDADRGFIEVEDGEKHQHPLMGLSIGVAAGRGSDLGAIDAAETATDMKQLAKRTPASSYQIHRILGSESSAAEEDPETEPTPLLRRARRGGVPPRLWDQLAALAELTRPERKDRFVQPHPYSVVIVDDEEDVRDVLRLHCEIQGFPVVGEAQDGTEAVELVKELHPTFVILDYKMREMDGDEAATRIRAVDPEVKIIAFSGVLDERPTWADDFLSKTHIAQITPLLGRFLEMGTGERRNPR